MKCPQSIPLFLFAALISLAGCRGEEANITVNEAERSARTAGERIQEQAGPALERAREQGKQAAQQAEKSLDAGAITLRVKTALAASTQLDVLRINVDTKGQTVHLRGTVPDERQISLAGELARNTVGPGMTVVNELQVKSAAGGANANP